MLILTLAAANAETFSSGVLTIDKSLQGPVLVTNSSSIVAGTVSGNGTITGDVQLGSSSAQALAQIHPDGPLPKRKGSSLTITGNLVFGTNSRAVLNIMGDPASCDRSVSELSCSGATR